MFRYAVRHDKAWYKYKTDKILSNMGARETMYKDLFAAEYVIINIFIV